MALIQAQSSLSESSQRLDLIRHSLELRNKELPPQQSTKAMELKRELESYTVSSPTPSSTYVSLQPFKSNAMETGGGGERGGERGGGGGGSGGGWGSAGGSSTRPPLALD